MANEVREKRRRVVLREAKPDGRTLAVIPGRPPVVIEFSFWDHADLGRSIADIRRLYPGYALIECRTF